MPYIFGIGNSSEQFSEVSIRQINKTRLETLTRCILPAAAALLLLDDGRRKSKRKSMPATGGWPGWKAAGRCTPGTPVRPAGRALLLTRRLHGRRTPRRRRGLSAGRRRTSTQYIEYRLLSAQAAGINQFFHRMGFMDHENDKPQSHAAWPAEYDFRSASSWCDSWLYYDWILHMPKIH